MKIRHEGKRIGGEEGKKAGVAALLTFSRSYLLFLLLCFLYLWLVVEPHLIYHGFGTLLPNAPLFTTGWPFLKDSLSMPGGPVLYASGFLSQGYYYAWLGAGIIVLAGFCLGELTRRHLVTAGLGRASLLAPFPAIMLFLVYSQYNHPLSICLAVSLGLLLSLTFEGLSLGQPLHTRGLSFLSRRVAPTIPAFAGMTSPPRRRGSFVDVASNGTFSSEPHGQTSLSVPPGMASARLSKLLPLVRDATCCLVTMVGFWLGGAGTWLVFALMTAIYATRSVKKWCVMRTLLALSAGAVVAWALAEYVFLIPAHEAWLILTPFAPPATAGMDPFLKILVFLLYGFVPGVVLLGLAGKSIFGRRRPKPRTRQRQRTDDGERRTARFRPLLSVLRLLPWVLPIVLMALGLYVSHKELRKPYVLSNYYACQKQWDKILELARRLPKDKNNIFVNHDILRALYHTGRLPYDMFCYPLVPESILLTHEKNVSDLTQWKLSDIFLELGHINMAQKLASELLTTKGDLGPVLEELGWINIIKGHPATARVYLQALKRDLIYRRRAESLLHGLDNGFSPEQTAYIDRIRSCLRDEATAITGGEPVDQTLAALLEHNPRNKMAFEYLMACYLLTDRVDKIAANVGRLRELGYQGIPTLYEEAILIYCGSQGRTVDLSKFNISPQTLQRYETFVRAGSAVQSQGQQAVFNDLIRDFGTSYFFYYSFGRVGLR